MHTTIFMSRHTREKESEFQWTSLIFIMATRKSCYAPRIGGMRPLTNEIKASCEFIIFAPLSWCLLPVWFNVIELKDDREDYLVRPELVPELAGEIVFKTVFTAINRQGVVFLWPVKIPGPDERRKNDWPRSAREAAEMAMTRATIAAAPMPTECRRLNSSARYTRLARRA